METTKAIEAHRMCPDTKLCHCSTSFDEGVQRLEKWLVIQFADYVPLLQPLYNAWVQDRGWLVLVAIAEWLGFDVLLEEEVLTRRHGFVRAGGGGGAGQGNSTYSIGASGSTGGNSIAAGVAYHRHYQSHRHHQQQRVFHPAAQWCYTWDKVDWRPQRWFTFGQPARGEWWDTASTALCGRPDAPRRQVYDAVIRLLLEEGDKDREKDRERQQQQQRDACLLHRCASCGSPRVNASSSSAPAAAAAAAAMTAAAPPAAAAAAVVEAGPSPPLQATSRAAPAVAAAAPPARGVIAVEPASAAAAAGSWPAPAAPSEAGDAPVTASNAGARSGTNAGARSGITAAAALAEPAAAQQQQQQLVIPPAPLPGAVSAGTPQPCQGPLGGEMKEEKVSKEEGKGQREGGVALHACQGLARLPRDVLRDWLLPLLRPSDLRHLRACSHAWRAAVDDCAKELRVTQPAATPSASRPTSVSSANARGSSASGPIGTGALHGGAPLAQRQQRPGRGGGGGSGGGGGGTHDAQRSPAAQGTAQWLASHHPALTGLVYSGGAWQLDQAEMDALARGAGGGAMSRPLHSLRALEGCGGLLCTRGVAALTALTRLDLQLRDTTCPEYWRHLVRGVFELRELRNIALGLPCRLFFQGMVEVLGLVLRQGCQLRLHVTPPPPPPSEAAAPPREAPAPPGGGPHQPAGQQQQQQQGAGGGDGDDGDNGGEAQQQRQQLEMVHPQLSAPCLRPLAPYLVHLSVRGCRGLRLPHPVQVDALGSLSLLSSLDLHGAPSIHLAQQPLSATTYLPCAWTDALTMLPALRCLDVGQSSGVRPWQDFHVLVCQLKRPHGPLLHRLCLSGYQLPSKPLDADAWHLLTSAPSRLPESLRALDLSRCGFSPPCASGAGRAGGAGGATAADAPALRGSMAQALARLTRLTSLSLAGMVLVPADAAECLSTLAPRLLELDLSGTVLHPHQARASAGSSSRPSASTAAASAMLLDALRGARRLISLSLRSALNERWVCTHGRSSRRALASSPPPSPSASGIAPGAQGTGLWPWWYTSPKALVGLLRGGHLPCLRELDLRSFASRPEALPLAACPSLLRALLPLARRLPCLRVGFDPEHAPELRGIDSVAYRAELQHLLLAPDRAAKRRRSLAPLAATAEAVPSAEAHGHGCTVGSGSISGSGERGGCGSQDGSAVGRDVRGGDGGGGPGEHEQDEHQGEGVPQPCGGPQPAASSAAHFPTGHHHHHHHHHHRQHRQEQQQQEEQEGLSIPRFASGSREWCEDAMRRLPSLMEEAVQHLHWAAEREAAHYIGGGVT